MPRNDVCAATTALVVWATDVAAQTQPQESCVTRVDTEVTRLVAEIELFRIRDDHLAMIHPLAHQEGVAVVCPGFVSDAKNSPNSRRRSLHVRSSAWAGLQDQMEDLPGVRAGPRVFHT